jgi:two-component SAPR family response regulator
VYTCGIIEDEYLAQQLLMKYINRYADLKIVWASETVLNPDLAPPVDIVFLDLLDNPSNTFTISEGINEFASQFPHVIITTAFPIEYVKSAGIHYTHVLTKPYTYLAFEKAVNAALGELK